MFKPTQGRKRGGNVSEYREGARASSEQRQAVFKPAVIQNLEDAGCDKQTVEQFIKLEKAGEKQGQLRLLERHRRSLLDNVHKKQKQIDCLDYLVYQIGKGRVSA